MLYRSQWGDNYGERDKYLPRYYKYFNRQFQIRLGFEAKIASSNPAAALFYTTRNFSTNLPASLPGYALSKTNGFSHLSTEI